MYYIIAGYIVSSILLAYLGRHSRLKFWGVLLTSLYMTPIVVGGILLFFGSSYPKLDKKNESSEEKLSSSEKEFRRYFSTRRV